MTHSVPDHHSSSITSSKTERQTGLYFMHLCDQGSGPLGQVGTAEFCLLSWKGKQLQGVKCKTVSAKIPNPWKGLEREGKKKTKKQKPRENSTSLQGEEDLRRQMTCIPWLSTSGKSKSESLNLCPGVYRALKGSRRRDTELLTLCEMTD